MRGLPAVVDDMPFEAERRPEGFIVKVRTRRGQMRLIAAAAPLPRVRR
jgi:hypothetical protein